MFEESRTREANQSHISQPTTNNVKYVGDWEGGYGAGIHEEDHGSLTKLYIKGIFMFAILTYVT